ncbi:MarR family winged helix-turn-helix transcriptional regulator [Inquilinus sp. NPDC058860]|uniref:MarR family winged helix-turn-helix transcriptional regulator n=1 Tax=Inquilinus sp. NPDC058860 TaxID=3346652 RepID=UPI0036981123
MSETKPLVSLYTLIKDLDQLLRRRFEERVRAAGLDLTRPQYRVLLFIDRNPGITQARLAEMLDVEKMTVTGLVDRMEKRGWVERRRDPRDRRAHALHLLPPARPIVQQLDAMIAQWQDDYSARLPAEVMARLIGDLQILKTRLTCDTDEPAADAARRC